MSALDWLHLAIRDGASELQARLVDLIPWDRERILDLSGDPAVREALEGWRWMGVESAGADRPLPYPDNAFDCVVLGSVDDTGDPNAFLTESRRVLVTGGAIITRAGQDGPAQLVGAGFRDVVSGRAGREVLLRGWKRTGPLSQGRRAADLVSWLNRHVEPGEGASLDPAAIVAGRVALCEGYAIAAREMLNREGYHTRWITMVARAVPHASGRSVDDSHEIVEIEIEGHARVVDPMANVWYEVPIAELLRDPNLADGDRFLDERAARRGYQMYTSSRWYGNVRMIAVRDSPHSRPRFSGVPAFLHDAH